MDNAAFAENYSRMSKTDLLLVASERAELVPEALVALDAELQKHGLTQIQAARKREYVDRNRASDFVGRLGFHRTWGKHFLGCSNYSIVEGEDAEEFVSTLWAFGLFLPLFPLGRVRIRRQREGPSYFWSFGRPSFTAMEIKGAFSIDVVPVYLFDILVVVLLRIILR
jgi:hypothetical protein